MLVSGVPGSEGYTSQLRNELRIRIPEAPPHTYGGTHRQRFNGYFFLTFEMAKWMFLMAPEDDSKSKRWNCDVDTLEHNNRSLKARSFAIPGLWHLKCRDSGFLRGCEPRFQDSCFIFKSQNPFRLWCTATCKPMRTNKGHGLPGPLAPPCVSAFWG